MPRRFFRKFALKRDHVSDRWFLTPFRHLLEDRRLWSIRRRTVVPAVALGLFIAFMPLPGHTIAAVLLSLSFSVNIPAAVLATLVSNPATMVPMYYMGYRVGVAVLNVEEQPIAFQATWDWLTHTFVSIWQPLLLGCCILGAAAAVIAYVLLDLLWRSSIADYKTRKRNSRRDR